LGLLIGASLFGETNIPSNIYDSSYIASQEAALNAQPYSVQPPLPGKQTTDGSTNLASLSTTVPSDDTAATALASGPVLKGMPNNAYLFNNDILAFYGHPNSTQMGILGRYSKDELYDQLTSLATQYDALNGSNKGVIKAFYIIFGTVWPGGDIGIIGKDTVTSWIQYAQSHNMIVFLDHQIGKYDPATCLAQMFPYLKYPNVHLALDPEWRTTKPMEEIGSISADELNACQKAMSDYIQRNKLGERLLVVHQFNYKMITSRSAVRNNYPGVHPVLCADGFGSPHLKRDTYAYIALAKNLPLKGFKLFYDFKIPGAGIDDPLLTPEQVVAL
jgi:hypothetical protein